MIGTFVVISVKLLHSVGEHITSSKYSSELHNPESIPIKQNVAAIYFCATHNISVNVSS